MPHQSVAVMIRRNESVSLHVISAQGMVIAQGDDFVVIADVPGQDWLQQRRCRARLRICWDRSPGFSAARIFRRELLR